VERAGGERELLDAAGRRDPADRAGGGLREPQVPVGTDRDGPWFHVRQCVQAADGEPEDGADRELDQLARGRDPADAVDAPEQISVLANTLVDGCPETPVPLAV